MKVFCNGRMYDEAAPLFTAANRSFRYGDGLFETVRVASGVPLLWPFHVARLQKGIGVLGMDNNGFDDALLLEQVRHLCSVNKCTEAARVRIAVYRTAENNAAYVIEALPLQTYFYVLNTKGWNIGFFKDVQISMDSLANLKKASYLPYALAALHVQRSGLDEDIVCNALGNVCEGSRTNIFVVKKDTLFTPALSEGCVAGVMRRFMLEYCRAGNIPCHEVPLAETDLYKADELFFTNAIQGIQWAGSLGQKHYGNTFTARLFEAALATIRP